jgi:uncharacterized membrane protein (DUF2068 family)
MLDRLVKRSIKAIAIFEGGKGLAVLVCTTLFIFVFDSDAHRVAETLIQDLHYVPQAYYPHLVLMVAASVTGFRLTLLTACAYLYSTIKLSEAYGLWRERQWGRTLGIASIGVLIPFEVYEATQHFSLGKLVILVLNIAVVALLYLGMKRADARKTRLADPG